MNVTTKKSECDPKLRIRQLEVAIEHALAAGTASHTTPAKTTAGYAMVEVSYPSFEFRETLKTLRPNAGLGGIWVVIDLGAATIEACKAACTVLQHYYPEEKFVVSTVPVILAS
jgi:hypothetical protein